MTQNQTAARRGHLPAKRHLKNGQAVRIRYVTRRDRALVEHSFSRLSERSRFLRFHSVRDSLTDAELNRITDARNTDTVAIGAETMPARAPVGLAHFIRLSPGGPTAELALTITDPCQRLGAGRLLLDCLVRSAAQCGIVTLLAFVHRENRGMKRLLRAYPWANRRSDAWDLEITLSVADMIAAGAERGTNTQDAA